MKLKLDPGAATLLDTLYAAGYAAYAVGGCVRDSLLGRTAHDWDLCTSALPQQVVELFGEETCIPTGLQHGTVTVKYGGQLYETTTFRTEGAYTDGRHPDEVHFVPDVQEDLARRDFTINAMAYNEKEGLVDPFGGQTDLQNGLLRAVGEPKQRFTEDALRILRLYRFAARFGFAIDPATAQAARELAPHLDCVSVERIEEELAKLLAAPQPGPYLEPAVLAVILPELPVQALEAARPMVDACPAGEKNLPVRLAALLLPLGEEDTRKVLKRLRCSNARIEQTAVLVREAGGSLGSFSEDRPLGWDPAAAGGRAGDGMARVVSEEKAPEAPGFTVKTRRLLGKYDLTTVQRLAALGTALYPERKETYTALADLAAKLEAEGVCCRIAQLAVNGRDLMETGIPAGPALRRTLEALLDGVIREEYPNEKQALLAVAQKISAS